MSVFVSPIGTGIGDVLISLPVLQYLIDRNEKVSLVTRSFRQQGFGERIDGLAGEITEQNFEELPDKGRHRYVNLRDHPLQKDHCWGSPEFESFFGKTRIEAIITKIAEDFGISADFQSLAPLKHLPNSDLSKKIALVPGSDGFYKHWPHEFWMHAWQELKRKGHECVVLGKPQESPAVARLIQADIPWHETSSIAAAIDAISSVKAAITVDTGLMHIAVQQNIPTFALIHPQNFHHRSAKNCVNFESASCPAHCPRDGAPKAGYAAPSALSVDLKFDNYQCQLPVNENCMASIVPEQILDSMRQHGIIN